jgi:hypothetical protein
MLPGLYFFISLAGPCSQSCFLSLNQRPVVLSETDKSTYEVFCAQVTSPYGRRGSDSMSRLHFAENIIFFSPGLHSRPGNLAKSPGHTDRLFFGGLPALFSVVFRVLSAGECYDSA